MMRGERSFRIDRQILLFLDYDGTLTDFKNEPQAATLSPARRLLLERLARKKWVCIVSGRSLAEIRRMVGVAGIAYIGNHGLEIQWNRRTWVHPGALRRRSTLRAVLESIELRSRGIASRRIEDKRLTASIHFRQMTPSDKRRMKRIARTEMKTASQSLVLREGNNVWEIRPRVPWDKGKAVTEILQWIGCDQGSLAIYVGDDRTDEDAFRELRKRGGLSFKVGYQGKTEALGRISDVDAVWRFLMAFLMPERPRK